LVDDEGSIIAGHGRLEAARLLRLETIPTIRIVHLNEKQKRALRIADNKIAENAGWDPEILALELQNLIEIDAAVDLTITGFETAEIDLIIESLDDGRDDLALDRVPEIDRTVPPISQPGDLWQLGRHRLLCGDATTADAFTQLMGGDKAQLVFIDPPYNVQIDGHVCGLGKIKHRAFVMAAGELSETEYIDFLSLVFRNLVVFSIDGAIHFVCMDWRHIFELLTAARAGYSELKNLCIWNKTNGGMGSLYRSKHELVFVFKSGRTPHINNVELGRYGRNRTNVWDYPGVNAFGEGRLDALKIHPTVKPVALVADAILDCSNRNGIVLDCFAGSGTTIVAAEQVGRRAFAMELDPLYVDATIRRWHDIAGEAAIHAETNRVFAEIEEFRAANTDGMPVDDIDDNTVTPDVQ
jgi:DNA modification methylase